MRTAAFARHSNAARADEIICGARMGNRHACALATPAKTKFL
jgi:hypothetical protein